MLHLRIVICYYLDFCIIIYFENYDLKLLRSRGEYNSNLTLIEIQKKKLYSKDSTIVKFTVLFII